MKRNLKRVSRRTLSVILAILIVMSTMLIGTLSVSAAGGKFSAGETIYFDFTQVSGGVNINLNSGTDYVQSCDPTWDNNSNRYINSVTDYVAVTLSKDIDFSTYSGNLCKVEANGWTYTTNDTSKLPTGSQNMLVITKNGYEWGTYGSSQDDDNFTVYFKNTDNWSTVKCYMWNSDTDHNAVWPGEDMTPIGDGIYKYTSSKQFAKCIFNNGASQNIIQTSDLSAKYGYLYTWVTGGKDDNKDTNWSAEPYNVSSDPHNVTIKSNIKVTATVDGVNNILNESGDSATENSITVSASTLTLTAAPADYNFAGWKLDEGATITSGYVTDKTITVKVTADTTITATAITLTPRLSVNSSVAKNTTATVKPNEEFTLNALSKVGDKTQKATKYTIDFYEYTTDIKNATHIGEQIVINDVSYDRINSLVDEIGNKREPGDGEYLIGDEYKAVLTLSRDTADTYYYYADIKGYDNNGNLTTGEYADVSLGTSRLKDEVAVTVVEPIDKANAYENGLWVDVQPSVIYSSIALLKWTNKSGPNGSSQDYTLYVPGGIDMTQMPIYSKINNLKINGTSVAQGGTYSFTDGGSYTVTGDGINCTLKVYQSTSDSMFTKTAVRYEADRSKVKEGDNLPTKSYGAKLDKVEYNGQFMSITANNGEICDQVDIEKIKGRGNSSWQASGEVYGKYAYNVKFTSKIKPLNMKEATKAKSWCLLANNMDESALRNLSIYETAMLAGLSNVPEYKVADLYNNGEYLGSYLITEKVDVGSSKLVNGETPEDHYDGKGDGQTHRGSLSYSGTTIEYQYVDTGNLIDGYTADKLSYLIEFDLQDRAMAEHSWFKTPKGQYIAFKAPEDINKDEMEFVIKKWIDAENAVYDNDYTAMNNLMDLDSFADVYLVQEFTKNLDSGATSYYVYWDGTSAQTDNSSDVKWEATPIWDYDWALGGYYKPKEIVSGTDSSNIPSETNGWLTKYKKIVQTDENVLDTMNLQAQLANNSEFWNTNVVNAWNSDFYDSINAVYSADGYLKDAYDANYNSFDMNEKRYHFIERDLTYTWGSVDTGENVEEAYNSLLNWCHNRAEWMNDKLGETVSVSLSTDKNEVKTGDSVTLTANLTRSNSNYPMTYQYYVSTDGVNYTLLTETTDTSYTTDAFTGAGTYSYYVDATYSTYTKATSSVQTVTVKGEEAKITGVSLTAPSSAAIGSTITLTATPTVEGTATEITYKYYMSKDNAIGDDTEIKTTTATNCTANAPETAGTYYYYVTATLNETTVTSTLVPVKVEEQQGVHTVTIYFKAPSSAAYKPTATLDGTAYTMTRTDTCLGSIYTGAVKIYWYTVEVSIDSSKAHTLTLTTTGTELNASITDYFNGSEAYLAVDNLMNGTEIVDLTAQPEYIRNYYHTPTHMVYSDDYSDGSLGFTFAEGSRHRMGSYIRDNGQETFSIDSVTAIQKLSADCMEASELQTCLFDCNLDGVVDINDATLMQKALAQ